MAIGFRNSSSGDIASATATATISLPTGTTATDVVVVILANDYTNVTAQSTSAPSGWTRIGTAQSIANGTEHVQTNVFWALGNVASLGFTNTQTGVSYQQGWVCLAFTGVDNTTPIDVAGVNDSNTQSNSLTASALTIATDQAWHIIAIADWLGGTFSATGFTNAENGHTNATAAFLYNQTPKSIGGTGTVAVSDSAASLNQIIAATSFALKPATAASGSVDTAVSGAIIPNLRVGPQALRALKHGPVPYDLTQAAVTDTNPGPLIRIPNNRVGPMALRRLFHPTQNVDTTIFIATGNRIRRVICSGA